MTLTDLLGQRVCFHWNENYGGIVRAVAYDQESSSWQLLVENIQGQLIATAAADMRLVKEEASEGPA